MFCRAVNVIDRNKEKQHSSGTCFALENIVKMTSIASIPRKLPLLLVTEDVLLPGSSIRVSVTSSAK